MFASFANNNKFTEQSKILGKSFTNRLNKRGPKCEPNLVVYLSLH